MSLGTSIPKIVTSTLPGPKSVELGKVRADYMPSGIGVSAPIFAKRAEGAMIEDVDGNTFLDFVGGIGVMNIGHGNKEIVDTLKAQVENYTHVSINAMSYEPYVALCKKLCEITPGDFKKKAMLVTVGAETSENAVKIARKYTKKTDVVVFTGAFHGRTSLTMEMTSKHNPYKFGFGPFPSGILRAEYPYVYRRPDQVPEAEAVDYYIKKLEQFFIEIANVDQTAAIVLEPLQGEGGFIPAPIEFVKALRKICDENNIVLVCDEVQSGFARTGKMFASEYWAEAGAAPDLILMAKSLGAGIPIGAVVGKAEMLDAVHGGGLGGTYAGNPVAAAAALKVIEIMQRDNYAAKSAEIGKKVMDRFKALQDKYECIGDVRGLGGMIGIEFVDDRKTKAPFGGSHGEKVKLIIKEAFQNGLLLMDASLRGNVIRFLAPLAITDEQLEWGLKVYEEAIDKVSKM